MGQTLSHGVYLPNEGERNCYAGLASNWQILNTAVGNIAEKAPLVHTHGNISNDGKVGTDANKPLITGTGGAITAGSFGNQANTFCEGNDSRLSDARTPVAHTHTKADVTDLLNSNFIPSANNSYDLGSSSYQWNNAYIKSLTINGVACGDILTHNVSEFVDVSSNQTIGGEKDFTSNQKMKSLIINPTASIYKVMYGSTEGVICQYGAGTVPESNINPFRFYVGKARNYAGSPIVIDTNMSAEGGTNIILRSASNESENVLDHRFYVGTSVTDDGDGTKTRNAYVQLYNTNEVRPNKNNYCNLGTASLKWADVNTALLNGLNPGALSLPDYSKASNIDTTNWNKNGTLTSYTPTMNGWLQITLPDDVDNNGKYTNKIIILDSTAPNPITGQASATVGDIRIYLTYPVIANRTYSLYIKSYSNTISAARFIPCQGNV